MCTTTRAAGARRAAAGGLHPAPLHGAADDPCAAKVAAHSEAYERALVDGAAEEADWSEPVRRLPLRELVVDPAVVIFMLMHVLAAATPWWYGGLRRQDVVITVASYVARMFGARWQRRPWVAKAPPVALRLRRLTQACPRPHRHHRWVPQAPVSQIVSDVASDAGTPLRSAAASASAKAAHSIRPGRRPGMRVVLAQRCTAYQPCATTACARRTRFGVHARAAR
jgi:hypothetical protein